MKQPFFFIAASVLIMLLNSVPASAHKVNIFAWVEGDTVHTQSKFSGGRPAKDSVVHVQDLQGNLLAEGRTDENGKFSFKLPTVSDFSVVLKASMGHMAEWKISVPDITQAQSFSAPAAPESEPSPAAPPPSSSSENISSDLNEEALRKIIEDALDKKLAPVTRMLAEQTGSRPGLTEIIGGVGYIMGLVGIALYMASRKKGS